MRLKYFLGIGAVLAGLVILAVALAAPPHSIGKAPVSVHLKNQFRLELMPEQSGEFLRLWDLAADGHKAQLQQTLRDGRHVDVKFNASGKFQSATEWYPGKKQIRFQARYSADGTRIVQSKLFAPDGRPMQTLETQADGTQVLTSFQPSGKPAAVSYYKRSGELVTSQYNERGEVQTTTTEFKAEPREFWLVYEQPNYYDYEGMGGGGTVEQVLKVKAVGYRIVSWCRVKPEGKMSHCGEIKGDGTIVITHFLGDDPARIDFKQYYRPLTQDHSQSYYQLYMLEDYHGSGLTVASRWHLDGRRKPVRLEEYNTDSRITSDKKFHPNGVPSEVVSYEYTEGTAPTVSRQVFSPTSSGPTSPRDKMVKDAGEDDPMKPLYSFIGTPYLKVQQPQHKLGTDFFVLKTQQPISK